MAKNTATDCDLVSEVGHLFTPYLSRLSKIRAYMELDQPDYEKFKALEPGQAIKVTDKLSGVEVLVSKTNCGLHGCYCAAAILSPFRY